MSHIQQMRAHYLALASVIIILIFPISWIYTRIKFYFGIEAAHLSLTGLVVVVLILAVRGAVHTYRIHQAVQEKVDASGIQHEHSPFVFQVLGVEPCCSNDQPVAVVENATELDLNEITAIPDGISQKRRRKRSRFSYEKIQRAVLAWEKRDLFFSANTLEEFLEQEFGYGPDGISLMPVSTFYDYRRQVLEEIEEHKKKK